MTPYRTPGGDKYLHTHVYPDARVISTEDPYDTMEITVRLKSRGGSKYEFRCTPFIPMLTYMMPKVGESVKIFVIDTESEPGASGNSYWIGPNILQHQNLPQQTWIGRNLSPQNGISSSPEGIGLFPEKEDVAVFGRGSSDVIFKKDEVLLRAAKHDKDDFNRLNTKNPAYVQLRFNRDKNETTAAVVADKVALLSHLGKPAFKKHLDQKELERVFEQAHPVAFGDTVKELFRIVIDFCLTHRHKGSNTSTIDEIEVKDLLERLHSEHIKVN